MANEEQLQLLKSGVAAWNDFMLEADMTMRPDLRGANLSRADLRGANLIGADFRGACLERALLDSAELIGADLSGANLSYARLFGARLTTSRLNDADLRGAALSTAVFGGADLSGARLQFAGLANTIFKGVNLSGANLHGVNLYGTVFADVDFRNVNGLEEVDHAGPCEISIGTIYLSQGDIPEAFLRGCGVPESFIVQIPALVAAMQPIQFYSCFISYSGKDEEFARRLHSRLRQAELRVWFAPEDMKGGDKLYDQIDRAIQVHDRLLLVLSESSLKSKWVEAEIRRARKVELREGRRKLFPIRLVSYEALQGWECIDSTTGEDLAEEVRSYFIPDFSNWKNHDDLEHAFARLLADLKASA